MHVGQSRFLDHLGGVPVAGGRVGADHARPFRMVRAGIRAGAGFGGTHLHLDDDRLGRIDQPVLHQRKERQIGRRGVAPHPADVTRRPHFRAVQFRQPVDELLHPLRRFVFVPVPFFIQRQILQPEIRREVDDFSGEGGIMVDCFLRLAVREGEEQHVAGLERLARDELHRRPLAQLRMGRVDVFADVPLRRGLDHLHLRMPEQHPQQFAAGVAGGADDGNLRFSAHRKISRIDACGTGWYFARNSSFFLPTSMV